MDGSEGLDVGSSPDTGKVEVGSSDAKLSIHRGLLLVSAVYDEDAAAVGGGDGAVAAPISYKEYLSSPVVAALRLAGRVRTAGT